MRAYTVATSAVAIGAPEKWVDNVLSHNIVHGVLQKRQGIARKVTPVGVLILQISRNLVTGLRLPVAQALDVAQGIISARDHELRFPGGVAIRVDVAELIRYLDKRLETAVEVSPTPRRGRPRSA